MNDLSSQISRVFIVRNIRYGEFFKLCVFVDIHLEAFFHQLEFLRVYLINIGFKIWKGIRNILCSPSSGFKQNIHDCLFFYKFIICFSSDSIRYICGFTIVDTIRGPYPVLFNWIIMRHAYHSYNTSSSLEGFLKHSSHIQITRLLKDMRQKCKSGISHRNRGFNLFHLL